MLTFNQFLITEATYGDLATAKNIIKTLRASSFQAYLVGGCVRDTLLGRTPKDYDVATDARPDQVIKLFPTADKVGAHFGVVIEKGVEIATFRSDGAYGDSRRPDSVQFEKSPREDAARRDFTVNAMFLDPFTGHVIDYCGGQEDLKKRVLRAVGDPYKRFGEDHLRMLRAMRFASKLGFTIEPETLAAMKGLAPHIKTIAPERITQEITGALAFPRGPLNSFQILQHTGMLGHILPELEQLSSTERLLLDSILGEIHHESHPFGLAAMFCLLGLPAIERIGKRLKLSNEEQKEVLGILSLQPRITAANTHVTMDVLKRLMRDPFFSESLKLYGMRVQAHDPHVHHEAFQFLTKLYNEIKHEDLHPEKFVTGDDLIKLGHRPGKMFKTILDTIEDKQLRGELHSKAETLAYIQTHYKG